MNRGAIVLALLTLASSQSNQSGRPQPFRSVVEAIRVPALVTNGNHPVTNLTAGDFELRDSGFLQTIAAVSVESLPVDVTLVLDASGSVNGQALARMKADVQAIADELEARDRVRLLTFSDDVREIFGFRPGGTTLPLDGLKAGGVSSFYEALAAALITDPSIDRPQLIFTMTDGRDTASYLSTARLSTLAGLSTATVYIALVESERSTVEEPGVLAREETTTVVPPAQQHGALSGVAAVHRSVGPFVGGPDKAALKTIAARTGGAVYDRMSTGALIDAFRSALTDFRSCYLLTYVPNGVKPGGWHPLEVRTTNRRYAVRARSGYDGG